MSVKAGIVVAGWKIRRGQRALRMSPRTLLKELNGL